MSTHRQIFYHIIFGTKHRERTISEDHCRNLYNYIFSTVKKHNCHLYRIGGMEDHLHIFSDLHPGIALAGYVKDIEVSSSLWMKGTGYFPNFMGWQEGYGAFTQSIADKDRLINYIRNQKEHHKHEAFYDEYKRILEENGVAFDERYLL